MAWFNRKTSPTAGLLLPVTTSSRMAVSIRSSSPVSGPPVQPDRRARPDKVDPDGAGEVVGQAEGPARCPSSTRVEKAAGRPVPQSRRHQPLGFSHQTDRTTLRTAATSLWPQPCRTPRWAPLRVGRPEAEAFKDLGQQVRPAVVRAHAGQREDEHVGVGRAGPGSPMKRVDHAQESRMTPPCWRRGQDRAAGVPSSRVSQNGAWPSAARRTP